MYEKKFWSERGLTKCWARRGKIKIAYLDGFGFIPKAASSQTGALVTAGSLRPL
jgi:hypothetical protein